jgi:hypothetical protein
VPASFTLTLGVEKSIKDFFRRRSDRNEPVPPPSKRDELPVAVG